MKSREHGASIAGDKYIILDAHAAPTRNVDTRSDRDHHPRFENVLRVPTNPRILMRFEAKPMTEAMREVGTEIDARVGAELRGGNYFAGCGIKVLRLCTR